MEIPSNKEMKLGKLIDGFVQLRFDSPQRQLFLKELITRLENKNETFHKIVSEMEHYLINPDDSQRKNAMILLVRLIEGTSELPMHSKHVNFFASFFTARIQDRPCLQESLHGLSVLTCQRKLDVENTISCIKSIIHTVDVRQLQFELRNDVFLIHKNLHHRPTSLRALKHLQSDYVVGFLASVDGEQDPRNLIIIFPLLKSLVDFDGWDTYVEELFEVISDYFPVLFTPPESNASITQHDLLTPLIQAMFAHPKLGPLAIPFLLEKLVGTAEATKIQSCDTLAMAIRKFGVEIVAPRVENIWDGLKIEILQSEHESTQKSALNCLKALLLEVSGNTIGQKALTSLTVLIGKEIVQKVKHLDNGDLIKELAPLLTTSLRSSKVARKNLTAFLIRTLIDQYHATPSVGKKSGILVLISGVVHAAFSMKWSVDNHFSANCENDEVDFDHLDEDSLFLICGVFMDAIDSKDSWAFQLDAVSGYADLAALPEPLVLTDDIASSAASRIFQILFNNLHSEGTTQLRSQCVRALVCFQKHHCEIISRVVDPLHKLIHKLGCTEAAKYPDPDDAVSRIIDTEAIPDENILAAVIASIGIGSDVMFQKVIDSLLEALKVNTSKIALMAINSLLTECCHNSTRMNLAITNVSPVLLYQFATLPLSPEVLELLSPPLRVATAFASSKAQDVFLNATIKLLVNGNLEPLFAICDKLADVDATAKVVVASLDKCEEESNEFAPSLKILCAVACWCDPIVTARAFPDTSESLSCILRCVSYKSPNISLDAVMILASLLNKVREGDLLDSLISRSLALSKSTENGGHISLLIGKALAMRGHNSAAQFLNQAIHALKMDDKLATVFGDLIRDFTDALCKDSHANIQDGHKDVILSQVIPQLIKLAQGKENEGFTYLTALSSLVKHTDGTLLWSHIEPVVDLISAGLNSDFEHSYRLLDTLHMLIEEFPEFFVTKVDTLLVRLQTLAVDCPHMMTRISALQNLKSLAHLSSTLPSAKSAVRATLMKAQDDDKREVRKIAREAMYVWSSKK